jgi:hypothetical protein
VEDKVNIIKQTESRKNKDNVCQEFSFANSTIKIYAKTGKKLLALLKRMDHKLKDYRSQNGVIWLKGY